MRRLALSVLAIALVALLLRPVVPVAMQMLTGDLDYYQAEQ